MEEQTFSPIPNAKPLSDKLFKISLIIIGFLIVLGLFGNIYLLIEKQTPIAPSAPTPIPTLPIPTIEPTDISQNVKPSSSIKGWTELSGSVYSLSFPNDWALTKAFEDLDSYIGQVVIITSSSNNTQLIIRPPDGWGHETKPTKETEISLVVGKNTYEGKEVLFQTEAAVSIYSYAQITDLLHQGSPYSVLYGNDYPTYLRNANRPSTIEQYDQDKQIIKQILSTFKFLLSASSGQADQTANWKTYNNTKYGFLFKYPSEYKYKENSYPKEANGIYSYAQIILADANAFSPEPIGQPYIMLTIIDSTDHKADSIYNNSTSISSLSVAGIQADVRQDSSGGEVVVFIKGSSTYEFNLTNYLKDKTLIDKLHLILSTFRFD